MAPLPRFRKLDAEKREMILDVAAQHFAAQGYEGASMNRILTECGLSKGAAYYYFDDKADLFATVVELATNTVFDEAALDLEALDAETWWPGIESLYTRQIVAFSDRPHLWRAAKAALSATTHREDGPRISERLAPLAQILQRVLTRGLELGVLRTDLPLDLLIAMVGGLDDAIDAWFLAHPEAVRQEGGDELAHQTFAAIRAIAASR